MENTLELINNVKEKNCSESFLKIKNGVAGIFYSVYEKRIKNSSLTLADKENFEDSLDMYLLEAINKFDPSKSCSFSTYWSYFCFWRANVYKQPKKRHALVNSDSLPAKIPEGKVDNHEDWLKIMSLMDIIKRTEFSDREGVILESRKKGFADKDIVEELTKTYKLSKQRAYTIIGEFNGKLKKLYEQE